MAVIHNPNEQTEWVWGQIITGHNDDDWGSPPTYWQRYAYYQRSEKLLEVAHDLDEVWELFS
jgi:hypothetical protein